MTLAALSINHSPVNAAMGIQGLLPLLKECQEASHIKEFKVRPAGLGSAVPSCMMRCSAPCSWCSQIRGADAFSPSRRPQLTLWLTLPFRSLPCVRIKQGQTLAIDAYVWLHRGAYGCAQVRLARPVMPCASGAADRQARSGPDASGDRNRTADCQM